MDKANKAKQKEPWKDEAKPKSTQFLLEIMDQALADKVFLLKPQNSYLFIYVSFPPVIMIPLWCENGLLQIFWCFLH